MFVTSTNPEQLTLADIQRAAVLLEHISSRTPVETSRSLSYLAGRPVMLKAENLQHSGSFKIRGSYVRLSKLSDDERARGVIAASAGNHAQGVAMAARELGISTTVYMPHNAALPKIEATKDYGARVELLGEHVGETIELAREIARATNQVFIHPFNHPDIIAGQGTIGLEILNDIPDAGTLVVPTGGGGLLAGVALAVKSLRPDIKVFGVQAAEVPTYPLSLESGHPVTVEGFSTMADGIAVATPGDIPYEIIAGSVDGFITVNEEDISQALLFCVERTKLVVEPSGVTPIAALMSGWRPPDDAQGTVVLLLSGGNVDPIVLLRVLRHGLSSAGRFMQFRLTIRDSPGVLAKLLNALAATGANVMHIEHIRAGVSLEVDEVALGVQLETKGHEHCQEVVAQLESSGYVVQRG